MYQSNVVNQSITPIEDDLPPKDVLYDEEWLDVNNDVEPLSLFAKERQQQQQQEQQQQISPEEIQQHQQRLESKVKAAMETGGCRSFQFERFSSNERTATLFYKKLGNGEKVVEEGSCSCGWLVHKGYLCRHLFRCLNHLQIHEIPRCFLDPKWYRLDLNEMSNAVNTDDGDFVMDDPPPSVELLPFNAPTLNTSQVADMRDSFISRVKDLSFQLSKMILDQHEDNTTSAEEAQKRMADLQYILQSMLKRNGDSISTIKTYVTNIDNVAFLERNSLVDVGMGVGAVSLVDSVSSSTAVFNPIRRGNDEKGGGGKSGVKPATGGTRKRRQLRGGGASQSTVKKKAGAGEGKKSERGGGDKRNKGAQDTSNIGENVGGAMSNSAAPPFSHPHQPIHFSQPADLHQPTYVGPIHGYHPYYTHNHLFNYTTHPVHSLPVAQSPFPGSQGTMPLWPMSNHQQPVTPHQQEQQQSPLEKSVDMN